MHDLDQTPFLAAREILKQMPDEIRSRGLKKAYIYRKMCLTPGIFDRKLSTGSFTVDESLTLIDIIAGRKM